MLEPIPTYVKIIVPIAATAAMWFGGASLRLAMDNEHRITAIESSRDAIESLAVRATAIELVMTDLVKEIAGLHGAMDERSRNESLRVGNENRRLQNERERSISENTRQFHERVRDANENKRVDHSPPKAKP